MPFKSKAQRAKMAELVKAGKLTQAQYDTMAEGTPADEKLPERLHQKKAPADEGTKGEAE